MPLSHRVERVAEQIREEVSQILATEVADPGIGLITVTRVKVSPDLSLARIYWTTMGDAAERKKTAKALLRAAAFVRHLLATRMSLRRSPEVTFLFDQSVAAQDRVEQILMELKQEEAARAGEPVEGAEVTEGADETEGVEGTDGAGDDQSADTAGADQPKRV
jgi:ribosome-binding factor A